MITDIYIIFDDLSVKSRIEQEEFPNSYFFHFIDEFTRKGKKEAYRLKNSLGAKETPFVILYNRDNIIKAFYTEADKDVIGTLINYLKTDGCKN